MLASQDMERHIPHETQPKMKKKSYKCCYFHGQENIVHLLYLPSNCLAAALPQYHKHPISIAHTRMLEEKKRKPHHLKKERTTTSHLALSQAATARYRHKLPMLPLLTAGAACLGLKTPPLATAATYRKHSSPRVRAAAVHRSLSRHLAPQSQQA